MLFKYMGDIGLLMFYVLNIPIQLWLLNKADW